VKANKNYSRRSPINSYDDICLFETLQITHCCSPSSRWLLSLLLLDLGEAILTSSWSPSRRQIRNSWASCWLHTNMRMFYIYEPLIVVKWIKWINELKSIKWNSNLQIRAHHQWVSDGSLHICLSPVKMQALHKYRLRPTQPHQHDNTSSDVNITLCLCSKRTLTISDIFSVSCETQSVPLQPIIPS